MFPEKRLFLPVSAGRNPILPFIRVNPWPNLAVFPPPICGRFLKSELIHNQLLAMKKFVELRKKAP